MIAVWKTIVTILVLYVLVIDGNRARRRRQSGSNPQPVNQNAPANTFNAQTDARQHPLGPSQHVLNAQGQPQSQLQLQQQQQQLGQGGMGTLRDNNLAQNQVGRQFSQYGTYGSQGSYNYPYGGMGGSQYGGMGGGQYGGMNMGQYGQYGQYGGSYQNQYPGAGNFYSGYGSNSYNRPGYQSNYYPSGSNGYFWNAGHKQHVNLFTVFLSSLLALALCLIAV